MKLMGGGTYKVSRDVQKRVMDLKLEGIYAIPTVGRQYVEGSLAAHVLGFVNLDNSGVGGVEQRYNDQLKGEPGEIRFKKDARGIRFPTAGGIPSSPARQGPDSHPGSGNPVSCGAGSGTGDGTLPCQGGDGDCRRSTERRCIGDGQSPHL